MPSTTNQKITLIDHPKALAGYCQRLASAGRIAVDTEFVGEKYYYPKLELIQVSDGHETALIDVPAAGSLGPLAAILGDPSRLKIFHAAESDVPILGRALGCDPLPLFDTQVAASLLGYGAQISLANLIRSILETDVSSKQSTSDWTQRPLTEAQLAYAAADVLYLHQLEEELRRDLESEGRFGWYEGEQEAKLKNMARNGDEDPATLYRRVKDWMSLHPRELVILRELAIWREERARKENLPRKAVFTDDGLIEFARFQPGDKEAARKLRRVHQGQVNRHFDAVREIIDRGRNIPRDQWPEKPAGERPDIPTGLLELCLALVRTESERRRIAPTVVATTSDLQRVVARRGNLDPDEHPILRGWRREVAGARLEALLRGEIVVRVGPGGALAFEDAPRAG